jgi:hypothetical protein
MESQSRRSSSPSDFVAWLVRIGGIINQIPKLRVDETDVYRDLSLREPTWHERTASRIAYVLVAMFGISLIVSFGMAFFVLYLRPSGTSVDQALIEISMDYLKTTGTIFSPLLAFILGYYFTKKED